MGIQEFEAMFNDIDLNRKGFVTADQIHKFCEDLYFNPVCVQHVEESIKLTCQRTDRVAQSEFLNVLTDIERRRSIDEQAYWDFQAFDYTGCNQISLRDALLLFRDYHGEHFSMTTWKRFINSREYPEMDVYFDEIRFWLCSPAAGHACSNKELKDEENQLMWRQAEFEHAEYTNLKNQIDDDETAQKEKEEYNTDIAGHARRKLNKWNREGVEAMLFDDGLDTGEDGSKVKVKATKGQVSMNELKELLEMKYENLKERLMLEMAKLAAPMDDEVEEMLTNIRRLSKQLIMEGPKFSSNVPAASMQVPASLTGLMGELRLQDREHRREMEQLKARMKSEGRTPREIGLAVQEQYEKIISGENTAGSVLIQMYRRHNQERDALFALVKQQDSQQRALPAAMTLEYCRIMRQLLVMEEEKGFVAMATTTGLAERAMEPKIDRADWDRSRSERLAELWLKEHVGVAQVRTSTDIPDESALQTANPVEMQVQIVREITQKHFYEREALIQLLLSKDGVSQLSRAKKVKAEDRKHQLKGLYNQHQAWKSNPRADTASLHNILAQALWLAMEERRREIAENSGGVMVSDEELREVILADLQQRQGLDFEMVLQDTHNMSKEDVLQGWKRQCVARIKETYDNIAVVVLGTLDITAEDEEYIKALVGKYDVLRKRILLMSLKETMDWQNLSKEEKKSALKEISTKERLLRSESKLQQMEPLVGPSAKILPALRQLTGEDKAEFQRRKNQHKVDEAPTGPTKSLNLLADLVPRFDSEHEYLLSWLHSPEAKSLGLRMKRMKIVEMKVEKARVEMEDEFEVAACSMGLMERVMETLTHRHARDVTRQEDLARKRIQMYRRRIQQSEEYRKEPGIGRDAMPKRGDITGLQVVYCVEMLKRHADERELILSHLMDESLEDLLECAAETMTAEERQRRLVELQGKHQNLNLTYPDDKEEHVSILEEAAAIRVVMVRQKLGAEANMESVCVSLLAELQEEQDREVALTLQQINNMNEEDIHTSLSREVNNRKLGTSWNVINVFTRYQGEATNDNLLKALEEKYTILRKQLLADSLRTRIGTDQWMQFSVEERQQKVAALDFQAQEKIRLEHILSSLLGDDFVLKETIEKSMGVCPHVFRNKVKGQQVTGHESNLQMEEGTGGPSSGAVSKKSKRPNPMKDLFNRFEDERLALVMQLKGQSEVYVSERERQVLLASYHRQCNLAPQAESFSAMAAMIGLMERQQEEIKFRLELDRQRYETLGKLLIFRLRGSNYDKPFQVDPSTSASVTKSIDDALKLLENKHIQERDLFQRFLSTPEKNSDVQVQAAIFSQQQRLDKMAELRKERNQSLEGKKQENLEVLRLATIYKKADRRSCLSESGDIEEDELCSSLLADLLELQNCEAQKLMLELALKDPTDIAQFQAAIQNSIIVKMADNVALVVLYPDRTAGGASETDLVEALKGKYDALTDKLLAEALMRELGETEWHRLSETERQRRVFELKMKEKKLRKEGKVDEANALIAELLKDQEHLRQLMGDSDQVQREKLQERLKRRKRRLAQGMTKEEIEAFEKEDLANEEEEEKYEERNILEDLHARFEQEKAELLRQLAEAGDDHDKEKERQARLAKLRRDERMARKEGIFSAAALALGLAEKHDKDLQEHRDAERSRQERLAHERLAARRERRQQGGKGDSQDEDGTEDGEVDSEDPASLQEAIARNMDRRQRQEREVFAQLLEDNITGPHRKAAHGMSPEEREDKIYELSQMYKNWARSEDRNPAEERDIFSEATGTALERVKSERKQKRLLTMDEDLMASLLADLQEQQKTEALKLLTDIENKDLESLQQLHKAQLVLESGEKHNNIVAVLLEDQSAPPEMESSGEESSGEATEAAGSVVKALQEKYDAMRDQLLVEALMKEHGEQEWNRLSEKERQRKLIQLKMKERKLRREGKQDEIAGIIGKHLENEKMLDELFGGSMRSQKQKIQERLLRRRELIAEREAEGFTTDDFTIDTMLDEEEQEQEKQKRRNILDTLQSNFDKEKQELLDTLAHQKDKHQLERERKNSLDTLQSNFDKEKQELLDTLVHQKDKHQPERERQNILDTLQSNFDKEKQELLDTLAHQKDKHQLERERQVALMKLKRDKRRMEKGQKLETVASIIYGAKEDEKKREQGIEAERERQRILARERLEARRQKKHGKQQQPSEQEMEENLRREAELQPLEDAIREAEGESVQESVLVAMETRQEEEMDLLMSLLESGRSDAALAAQIRAKSEADLKAELTGLEQEHMKWKQRSRELSANVDLSGMDQAERDAHLAATAHSRTEHTKTLINALAIRLEVDRRQLQQKQPELSADQVEEELQVAMVTSLQEKQGSEGKAVMRLVEVQDEATLQKIRATQQTSQREGWMDNLVSAIFHMQALPGDDAGGEERERIEQSFAEALEKVDSELERQREKEIAKAEAELPNGADFDEAAVRERLTREFDEKKQVVLQDMKDQRESMLKKLVTRQMTRDQADYEDQVAKQLLQLARAHKVKVKVGQPQELEKKYGDVLKQRLAERREARQAAKDVKFSMERENTLDVFDDDRLRTPSSRPSTNDSSLPPFGLRREKTVVDVDVTEEQKQAIISQMVSQQRNLQSKISSQQERQREMLKRRLEARQGNQKEEAAELLNLGQRQKTILEKSKQDEKERQLQKMKEKVSRLKDRRESSPVTGNRQK